MISQHPQHKYVFRKHEVPTSNSKLFAELFEDAPEALDVLTTQ